ncbi:MAG: hypothetical protein HYW27_02155 [Candidatus Aenigmarchaeota archaeon]|nr:hypothetical protein [Candidatus Aenigmarchaeota archaeon]
MSTEFYADLKDMDAWDMESMPSGLVAASMDGRLQIGICYGNGDRRRAVVNLIQGNGHDYASIEELCSSGKPYFSKWSEYLPIEFFDTPLRFSWHIPIELQEPAEEIDNPEDYQRGMLDFWDSFLHDDVPIYHGSTHPIGTWKELKDALFGEKRYMEPSRFVQGTARLF